MVQFFGVVDIYSWIGFNIPFTPFIFVCLSFFLILATFHFNIYIIELFVSGSNKKFWDVLHFAIWTEWTVDGVEAVRTVESVFLVEVHFGVGKIEFKCILVHLLQRYWIGDFILELVVLSLNADVQLAVHFEDGLLIHFTLLDFVEFVVL